MPNHIITVLASKPGINRDSTNFDSINYIDGNWVRFYNDKPRKMGGYKLILPGDTEIIRQIFVPPLSLTAGEAITLGDTVVNKSIIFIGRGTSLKTTVVDINGNTSPEINRTPTIDFVPSGNNTWSFDSITVDSGRIGINYTLALAVPNINNINGNSEGLLYYGLTNDTAIFTPIKAATPYIQGSGFVLAVEPFVIVGGNEGVIQWSDVSGDITSWPDDNVQSIANTKLIAGLNVRGGGVPTALIWSITSLIRISYNNADTPAAWNVDIIEDTVTILGINCVVNYKSVVYWIGVDQFYIYTGVVQELPNSMNKQYFFDNLNKAERAKVWGMVIPQFNEIWWFAPLGDSTECNHAFIYNYAAQVWYDTPIARTCGFSPQIFPYPLMADSVPHPDLAVNPPEGTPPAETFSLWMHEFGLDEIRYIYTLAINSYFETSIITVFDQNPGNDFQFRTRVIEPDFGQSGQMTVQVKNRGYANDIPVVSSPVFFGAHTNKVDVEEMGRLVSYIFSSNTTGGFYQMGKVLIQYLPGDQRPGS